MEQTTLAEFRPKLKPGQIENQGEAHFYVVDGSRKKVKAPKTFLDFFTLAQGEHSIQEIFSKFYECHQYVPFRGFLNFIFDLAKLGVLENSKELRKLQQKKPKIDFCKNIVLGAVFFEILVMVINPSMRATMITPVGLTLSTFFLLETWSLSYFIFFAVFPLVFCLSAKTMAWGIPWLLFHCGLWLLRKKGNQPEQNRYAISLKEKIASLPIFATLDNKEINSLLTKARTLYLPQGSVITKKGELAKSIYILVEGEAEVVLSTSNTKLISPCVFGENALHTESVRQADVKALTPVQVLQIDANLFPEVNNPESFELEIAAKQFFKTSPVFSYFGEDVANAFLMYGRLLYLGTEQVVFEENSTGESLYLLLRGSVDVQMQGKTLKELKQGDLFGEISLMAHIPRTASVVTKENALLLEIPSTAFWEVLTQNLDLALLIESIGAQRFTEGEQFKLNLKSAS